MDFPKDQTGMDGTLQPGKSPFPPGLIPGAPASQMLPAQEQTEKEAPPTQPLPTGKSHARTIISAIVVVAVILGIVAYFALYGHGTQAVTTTIMPTTATTSITTTTAPTTSATTTILPINTTEVAEVANIVNSSKLVQLLPNANLMSLYNTNDSLGIFTRNLTLKYNLTNSTNLYYIFDLQYGLPFTANYLAPDVFFPINYTIPIPESYSNYTYPLIVDTHASALQSPQAAIAAALYHTNCGCLGPTEKVSVLKSNSTTTMYLASATVNGMQYYGAFFYYKDFYASMITMGVKGKMNASYSIAMAKYYYSLLQK